MILLTNDDGEYAPGILAMREALLTIGRVVVVAPDRELSGVGHGITLHHPLRVREPREDLFVVDGTPTDCVNLGVLEILREPPALVVAGVNRGGNLGDDVTYSGTVAAAMEGALLGVTSIAVSLDTRAGIPDVHMVTYAEAAAVGLEVARAFLGRALPPRTLLNVNVPGRRPVGEMVVTRQGRRSYTGGIVTKTDPRGKTYYWIGGQPLWEEEDGSDQVAVAAGKVSITPLMLDLTHHGFLEELSMVLAEGLEPS